MGSKKQNKDPYVRANNTNKNKNKQTLPGYTAPWAIAGGAPGINYEIPGSGQWINWKTPLFDPMAVAGGAPGAGNMPGYINIPAGGMGGAPGVVQYGPPSVTNTLNVPGNPNIVGPNQQVAPPAPIQYDPATGAPVPSIINSPPQYTQDPAYGAPVPGGGAQIVEPGYYHDYMKSVGGGKTVTYVPATGAGQLTQQQLQQLAMSQGGGGGGGGGFPPAQGGKGYYKTPSGKTVEYFGLNQYGQPAGTKGAMVGEPGKYGMGMLGFSSKLAAKGRAHGRKLTLDEYREYHGDKKADKYASTYKTGKGYKDNVTYGDPWRPNKGKQKVGVGATPKEATDNLKTKTNKDKVKTSPAPPILEEGTGMPMGLIHWRV